MNLLSLLSHLPPIGPDKDPIAILKRRKGARTKYEETYGAFRLNTVMPKGSFWPYDFGFIKIVENGIAEFDKQRKSL
jgi:hypothetical protein